MGGRNIMPYLKVAASVIKQRIGIWLYCIGFQIKVVIHRKIIIEICMRLIIPLVIFPLLTVTAQAAEIRLECRNYGSMETFAENHVKLRPAETEKQVQTCLATGQSLSLIHI